MLSFKKVMFSFRFLCMSILSAVILVSLIAGTPKMELVQSQGKERKVEYVYFPENVLEVTHVENLLSEEFPMEFAIEVKNLSNKPIYHIRLNMIFPDVKRYANSSRNFGLPINYGEPRLGDFKQRVSDTDKPLLPGKTALLKTDSKNIFGLHKFIASLGVDRWQSFSKVELRCSILNFGDGTGFVAAKPYPLSMPRIQENIKFKSDLKTNSLSDVGQFRFSEASLSVNGRSKSRFGCIVDYDLTFGDCIGNCSFMYYGSPVIANEPGINTEDIVGWCGEYLCIDYGPVDCNPLEY